MTVALFWLLLSMILFGSTEVLAKKYAVSPHIKYIIWSIILGAGNTLAFMKALQSYNSLSILGTLWNIAYVVVTMSIAYFMYQEPLTTKQIIGFILAVVGVFLMSTH